VYTITVDASVHDQFGHPLQEGLASTFTTTPFRVYFTFPANGRTGVSPGELIQVSLTSAIDTGTVRSAFSITPNVPGQLYVNVRDLEFKASPQLAPEASYTITIDSSLRGAYGERLASPYRFSFTTAPFRVTDTQPGDGSDFVYRGLTIGVYCNAMIDSTTSRSSFTLRDSTGAVVAGSVINPSYQTDYFYFSPTGLFLPRMTYTATVSTSLKMLGGAPLSAPYTFVFKTAQ
jgi:hypothetical protein